MLIDALRLPLRFLRGSTARLLLTVIALALGVALVCAIDLANRAVLDAFVEVIDTMAGRAALRVVGCRGAWRRSLSLAAAQAEGSRPLSVTVVHVINRACAPSCSMLGIANGGRWNELPP